MEEYISTAVKYGTQIVLALVILVVGLKVIKVVTNSFKKRFERRNMDPSVRSFLVPFLDASMKVLLTISVISLLGVEVTSFAAILGSAGLAVGLAFQGSLSNFAGGVLILVIKPFKVGDFIQAGANAGTVKDIQIFQTTLRAADNKMILIPNAGLSNATTIVYPENQPRRLDFGIKCPYDIDIEKTKELLGKIVDDHKETLAESAPLIRVDSYTDSNVVFRIQVWVNSEKFEIFSYDLFEETKSAFDKLEIKTSIVSV